jgi:cob(I)alamin adenosyltransferase
VTIPTVTKEPTKGLVIVFTGDGKGKTTAAMGMAMRAAGHGLKCLMIQFIKGGWRYGELEAAKRLSPHFEMIPMGKGFIRPDKGGPAPEDLKAIRDAWNLFREKMAAKSHHMIILDEINNVIGMGLLPVEEVLAEIEAKPPELHLILTGRGAHPRIVEAADLVTEMREIKHPFALGGIQAQKGIEY